MESGLKMWDPVSGEEVLALAPGRTRWPATAALHFSPDGRRIVAATNSHVYVWDAPPKFRQITLRGHSWAVRHSILNRDGSRLASKSWAPERLVNLWNVAAGRPLLALEGGTGMAFNPDGTRFAAGVGDSVTVYDAGRPLHRSPARRRVGGAESRSRRTAGAQ